MRAKKKDRKVWNYTRHPGVVLPFFTLELWDDLLAERRKFQKYTTPSFIPERVKVELVYHQ